MLKCDNVRKGFEWRERDGCSWGHARRANYLRQAPTCNFFGLNTNTLQTLLLVDDFLVIL